MNEEKRNQWLEERRKYIGGSDVAAILGIDPRRGKLDVWLDKVYGLKDQDNEQMLLGRLFERPIGQAYSIKSNRYEQPDGLEFEIKQHPEIPFLGTTLDSWTFGSDENPNPFSSTDGGPLEIKKTNGYIKQNGVWKRLKADEWISDAPLYYQAQVQTQIACMGAQWGCLAALVDNTIVWRDFERHDKFLSAIYPVLEDFWRSVVDKKQPPIDDRFEHLETIKRAFPDDNHETIEIDAETAQVADEWEEIKKEVSALAKRQKELEAKLRLSMGENTFGILPDGRKLTLRKQFRKGYTRVVEPSEFRVLRIAKK